MHNKDKGRINNWSIHIGIYIFIDETMFMLSI